MAKASAQSDEDAERERKREAIRQRIAAAKAAQAGANGENLASADCVPATAAAGWAARPPADASEGLENDMARKLELGARAGADLLQHDGHRIGLAEAEGDEFWDTGASHAVQALPLPTEEPGKAEGITYKTFDTEAQMVEIVALIDKDLSEPYSIFTYRYFVYNWPQHTHMAMKDGRCVAVAVSKLERHRDYYRGYVAMLAVDDALRGKGIGTCLIVKSILSMRAEGCEEIVLETECSNAGALRLYENLGFFRDKRLLRYYLNGGDAFRLKLWFPGVDYYT